MTIRKQGISFFPLDVDFFDEDGRIRVLQAKFPATGPLVFIFLLCQIYRNGYYLRADEDVLTVFAYDLKIELDELKKILEFLVDRELFNKELYEREKVITSKGIQKRYMIAVRERGRKNPVKVDSVFWLLEPEETDAHISIKMDSTENMENSAENMENSTENMKNSAENSAKERKGKERKGKVEKSKVKKGRGKDSQSPPNRSAPRSSSPPLFPYGKYQNVMLSESQYDAICDSFERPDELIDKVSRYLAISTREFKNHFALIDKITQEDKWPKCPKPEPVGTPFTGCSMPDNVRKTVQQIRQGYIKPG